jgi:CO dehydrogenase/acetyl-CoA synthase alpha subunit
VEARFGTFGDSATLDARLVLGLHRMCRRLKNSVGGTRWNSLVTWVMWNLVLIDFETVLASVQDWCTVCVERTVGSEIVLEAPDGTPRLRGSCGILFRSVLK